MNDREIAAAYDEWKQEQRIRSGPSYVPSSWESYYAGIRQGLDEGVATPQPWERATAMLYAVELIGLLIKQGVIPIGSDVSSRAITYAKQFERYLTGEADTND